MSVSLPNGAIVAIANGYGSPLTVTAATNAAPPVLTSTAHGLANGDFVEVSSGWGRIDQKVCRVSLSTTNTFALENIDTTLTSIFPVGSGAGSVRKITGYTQLSQIVSTSSSGGAQQFVTYQFLEGNSQVQIPTVKNPFSFICNVADDITQAGYIVALAANDDRLKRAVKVTLASGSILSYCAYVSVDKTPSLAVNTVMESVCTFSMLSEPTRY